MRLLAAFLLGVATTAAGLGFGSVVQAIDSSDINVCYRTDGQQIETSYIDAGATSYYPIETFNSVTPTEDGFVARHEAWFERRHGGRVYMPAVIR